MLSGLEKQLLVKLKSNTYPDISEDGKGFFILWADGRGQVGYKNKSHAIAFIEQGDRDTVSVVYREREKGETVRNIFSPDKSVDKSATVHNMLYKEAQAKWDHQKRVTVNDILFADMKKRLDKSAMARQSGGSTLRNSGWNTSWDFVDPTRNIEKVKKQVGQKAVALFSNYGGHIDLRPDPIAFVFKYIRTIVPDKNDEAGQKAINALDMLEQILPGFRQFQQTLESNSIPLSPYFMTSNPSRDNGGIAARNLNKHLTEQLGKQLKLPDGRMVPNTSHYQQHAERINSGGRVKLPNYPNINRIFSIREVDNIPNSKWLVQAIADKAVNGYVIDENGLKVALKALLDQKLEQNGIDFIQGGEMLRQVQAYHNHYGNLGLNMLKWWDKRGWETNTGEMTAFMLRLILKNVVYTGGGVPEVSPDEFRIQKASSQYDSNGWDSSPDDPSTPMLVLPPIRQLPHGDIVPDRGNGNMGYDHLVLNWQSGLGQIFDKWGDKTDEWLRTLQNPNIVAQIAQQSPEVYEAWQNIVSLETGNATGAEGLLNLLEKYPDWNSFNSNHLQKSFASELRTVNSLLKDGVSNSSFTRESSLPQQIQSYVHRLVEMGQTDPEQASNYLKKLSSELCSLYSNKQMDWDNLTLALHTINKSSRQNPGIKSNGMVTLTASEKANVIDKKGFEDLKRNGYQMAKMMDFLYAVMTRCSYEKVNTRADGREENFYGHQYSGSSGKSSGGDILLQISYDQLYGSFDDKGAQVIEKQQFSLGQRTGSNQNPVILRSSLPWQQMVDAFNELYPEAQLTQINEPVSIKLDALEVAVKEAINEVRGQVQVTYTNSEGRMTILSGEELSEEQMNVSDEEDISIPVKDSTLAPPIESETQPEMEPEPEQQYTDITLELDLQPSPEKIEEDAFGIGINTPTTPKDKTMLKPMEEGPVDYLKKRNNKGRRLFRQRPSQPLIPQLGSVEERLQKAANILDEHGKKSVSNKIDRLLQKLCEVKDARKESNI